MLFIFQRLLNRKRNPKDFAYSVFAEFGPKLRIDRDKRLKAKFPGASSSDIAEWLHDFDDVEKSVWFAAEAGGSVHNSREELERFLQSRFGWLDGDGLRTAMFRIDYFAWHEGFHESPTTHLKDEEAGQVIHVNRP